MYFIDGEFWSFCSVSGCGWLYGFEFPTVIMTASGLSFCRMKLGVLLFEPWCDILIMLVFGFVLFDRIEIVIRDSCSAYISPAVRNLKLCVWLDSSSSRAMDREFSSDVVVLWFQMVAFEAMQVSLIFVLLVLRFIMVSFGFRVRLRSFADVLYCWNCMVS